MLSEYFEDRRREESIAQVNRDVQLREFEGKIWLCYNNVPIVEESQLKETLCNTVEKTREAVCRYYKLCIVYHGKSKRSPTTINSVG